MRKKVKQFSNVKLVVGIVLLVILVLLGYLIYMYKSIENDKTKGFDETEKHIYEVTEIVSVDKITSFQSEELFHVITGKDSNKQKLIVFLPLEDKENVTIIPYSETIPEENMIKSWNDTCKNCTSLTTNYAMINGEPLWELTYNDGSNRYVFDYFSLADGEQYEQLRLYQKYK